MNEKVAETCRKVFCFNMCKFFVFVNCTEYVQNLNDVYKIVVNITDTNL